MKLVELLRRALDVGIEFLRFITFRKPQTREGALSGFELLAWSIALLVIVVRLLHYNEVHTFLESFQTSLENEEQLFYAWVDDRNEITLREYVPDYPPDADPQINRFDLIASSHAGESRLSPWYDRIFFQIGFDQVIGVILPASPQIATGIQVTKPSELDYSLLDQFREAPELINLVQKDQHIVLAGLYDETRIGFGFTRVVFDHLPVKELSKNEAYLFLFLMMYAICIGISLHCAGMIMGYRGAPAGSLNRMLAIFAHCLIATTVLVVLDTLFPQTVVDPENEEAYQTIGIISFVLAVSAYQSIHHFQLSWWKNILIVPLSAVVSVLPGLLVFIPALSFLSRYHELIGILL